MDIYAEWSKFLRANVPRLMRELKTIRGTPSHQYGQETQYPDVVYMTYYTREQREPEFLDYRVHSDFHGNITTKTLPGSQLLYNNDYIDDPWRYNNDHMFKLVLFSNLQQEIVFSVHATEFLNPLDMEEDTNQLYSILNVNPMGPQSPDLLDRCRKIVWNWLQECIYIKLCQDRTKLLKKDIAATVWHPRRVAKWIEAGISLEDM